MIQNLKIDIIYYDTPSDFEFEFNLGGCCHSRVLNSKTSSPKEMIGCLSKAVSRSRVILIIGKLDGSDGLYSLISKAIGLPLSEVNAEEYGIAQGTNTTVIANSLPLISTDGLLAGCIVESGPQSIVLLPDAKSLRKDIAENLIFQYITAVSRTPDTETVISSDSAENEVADIKTEVVDMDNGEETPEEQITEETEEEDISDTENEIQEDIFSEKPEVSQQDEENNDTVISETEENEEEQFIDIFAEDTKEKPADIDNNYVYNDYSDTDTDDEYEEAEEDDYEEHKTTKGGINTFIWIIVGLMFIIAAILLYMLVYTPIKGGTDVIEYINQILSI